MVRATRVGNQQQPSIAVFDKPLAVR
jgi:hypothetical protein